jgi:hypothetical protein
MSFLHLIIHSPPTMSPSRPFSCLLCLSPFSMCPAPPLQPLFPPHLFMPRPHSFGTTIPDVRPILRASLHINSSGRSSNPGGNTKGRPCPRGVGLAGPSSIPRKQLLKRLVVVRHRLHHNGKVWQRIKGTSIRPWSCQKFDCVCRWCTIIQRLQLQIIRIHAYAMCLMQRLGFVVVVVLSICRRFHHFCIYQ